MGMSCNNGLNVIWMLLVCCKCQQVAHLMTLHEILFLKGVWHLYMAIL